MFLDEFHWLANRFNNLTKSAMFRLQRKTGDRISIPTFLRMTRCTRIEHVCKDCAKNKGVDNPKQRTWLRDADLLLGLWRGTGNRADARRRRRLKMPALRFFAGRISTKKSGRLGCPECYQVFAEGLEAGCSRRCTRARGTPASPRKRCAASRATTPTVSCHCRKTGQGCRVGGFRAGGKSCATN